MRSVATAGFWRRLDRLPSEIREQAKEAYAQWLENPRHPSLHFKSLKGKDELFSVRIGIHYRAVARREEETIQWIWIGSHADYDDLLRSL